MRLDLPSPSAGRTAAVPVESSSAVAAVVGWAHITSDVMDAMPDLKVLATTSVGTDMIDLDAAAARGIKVINLAGVATEEVAAHALALILAVERGLLHFNSTVKGGGWLDDIDYTPRRLSELTLGLVGTGRIGAHLAKIASPLFKRVVAFDPYVDASVAADLGIELVSSRDELLEQSDVLSLHVPSTDETRNMVDADFLAKLPQGATLINVSRGDLVVDADVIAALDSGHIRNYATDVLRGDPPAADNPLIAHKKVLVTPHAAFLSDASLRGYMEQPARNIVDALSG